VPDGDATFRHIGTQGVLTDGVQVTLRTEPADPDFVWPSSLSGNTPVRFGILWALVARQSTASGFEQFAAQFPGSAATLIVEAKLRVRGSDLPAEVAELLGAVRYAGAGQALLPPGAPGSRTRYVAASAVTRAPAAALNPASPLSRNALAAQRSIAAGGDPSRGNHAVILDHGYDALLARIHLIRNASRSIAVQTFIWDQDEVGRLLLHELIKAARRGVKVRLIADHMFSVRDVGLIAALATASPNLEMRHYRPAARRLDPHMMVEAFDFLIPNGSNQRMHNKLLLVDDVAFITGGRNIQNTYYNRSPRLNYRDRDILVIGPMATYAAASFDEYWNFDECVPSANLKDVAKAIRDMEYPAVSTEADFGLGSFFDDLNADLTDSRVFELRAAARLRGVGSMTFIADPPGKPKRYYTAWRRGTMARRIEEVMSRTRNELLLQSPYLVLDGAMLKMFRKIRSDNPRARVAMSSNSYGSTDNVITYAANFKLRQAYMEYAGLDVFEFMPRPAVMDALFKKETGSARSAEDDDEYRSSGSGGGKKPFLCLHAKGFVVDRRTAFIGSYNFDPRSIEYNTECGVIFEDDALAGELAGLIERDIQPTNSWVIARRKDPSAGARLVEAADIPVSRGKDQLWAARFTSSFRLKAGQTPVEPVRPEFYERYADDGVFPGGDDASVLKEIYKHISTMLVDLVMPLL
jgi:phosphatidylserine/phosphatidylglycerophosphate/cardiolipin synthase-like enzyme